MGSTHHYDGEPHFAMGMGGGYFYKGSTKRSLTLMDNLSLIAGLEIYGVESITHTYTYIMLKKTFGRGASRK